MALAVGGRQGTALGKAEMVVAELDRGRTASVSGCQAAFTAPPKLSMLVRVLIGPSWESRLSGHSSQRFIQVWAIGRESSPRPWGPPLARHSCFCEQRSGSAANSRWPLDVRLLALTLCPEDDYGCLAHRCRLERIVESNKGELYCGRVTLLRPSIRPTTDR